VKRIITPSNPTDYLYPNRKEMLEELSDEIRAALARVLKQSKEAFMAELTAMVLAE
jgi:hypothetical protein